MSLKVMLKVLHNQLQDALSTSEDVFADELAKVLSYKLMQYTNTSTDIEYRQLIAKNRVCVDIVNNQYSAVKESLSLLEQLPSELVDSLDKNESVIEHLSATKFDTYVPNGKLLSTIVRDCYEICRAIIINLESLDDDNVKSLVNQLSDIESILSSTDDDYDDMEALQKSIKFDNF